MCCHRMGILIQVNYAIMGGLAAIVSVPKGAKQEVKAESEPINTVHLESIQTPSLFPHFVALQPYSKIDYFFLINLYTILHNDKAKRGF